MKRIIMTMQLPVYFFGMICGLIYWFCFLAFGAGFMQGKAKMLSATSTKLPVTSMVDLIKNSMGNR